jgi:glycosyltransferase involved in cell wall biosynthesis
VHRALGTWRRRVAVYIALTAFGRAKMVEHGLPAARITIKPNFVGAPPAPRYDHDGYALFLGRLSAEKGLFTLLEAWRELPDVPLRIAGDGPLAGEVAARIRGDGLRGITAVGPLSRADCFTQLRNARFVVAPSLCYETFARVIVEAFACGTPVLASRLGAMAEVVTDGATGLHFSPGDPADLARKARQLTDEEPRLAMARAAYREFIAKYTESRNHDLLMRIYGRAMAAAAAA